MEMTAEQKKWIDGKSFEELLRRWRNSPAGDPIFRDDAGAYYIKVMDRRRAEIGPGAAVAASKSSGVVGADGNDE